MVKPDFASHEVVLSFSIACDRHQSMVVLGHNRK
jgi:hypothetical protein